MNTKLYCGIDLHSSNCCLGIRDQTGKRLFYRRVKNDLKLILKHLEPFRMSMESMTVESTYNWYWLVDGLIANGYNVKLANPGAIQQYSGLKNTDDKSDSFWLAELLRLDILLVIAGVPMLLDFLMGKRRGTITVKMVINIYHGPWWKLLIMQYVIILRYRNFINGN